MPLFRSRRKGAHGGYFRNRTTTVGLDKLIADAQRHSNDDTPAMNEVVKRFEGLTMRLSRSMTRSFDLQDDLANAARIALVQAVRNHDQSRPGFPAYAEKYMRGAVLREYQKWMLPEIPQAELVEAVSQGVEAEDSQRQVLDRLVHGGGNLQVRSINLMLRSSRSSRFDTPGTLRLLRLPNWLGRHPLLSANV